MYTSIVSTLEHTPFRCANYAIHKYESRYIWYIHSLGTSYCSSLHKRFKQCCGQGGRGQQVQFPPGTHLACIANFKSGCFFWFAFMLLGCKLQCTHLTCLLHSSLARAQYVILFNLKLLNKDSNLQVYMYCICMHKNKPQKPPEHTSEHVKLPGGRPLPQSILWTPLFIFALGLSNPLGGPGFKAHSHMYVSNSTYL